LELTWPALSSEACMVVSDLRTGAEVEKGAVKAA